MRNKLSSQIKLYVGLVVIALIGSLFVSFRHGFELMGEHHDKHIGKQVEDHKGMISHRIGTETLKHEDMFVKTLKDCLPSEQGDKCKTYIPEKTERIGILAPPGHMTDMLLKYVQVVVEKGHKAGEEEDNGQEGSTTKPQIEIIPTTHIPPYGYGKTHGYTRIIRIIPQPLLVGATESLLYAIERSSNQFTINDITIDDLKSALRQQIRYQCRLSHIAAHTAIWSIGVEDIADHPIEGLIDIIQEFLGLEENEVIAEDIEVEDMKNDDVGNSPITKLNAMYANGAKLLSLLQSKLQKNEKNILQILDDVLLNEMQISNNLTNWPCESFWTVGGSSSNAYNNPFELSPIIQTISKTISPNCTAPYTSCSVKRDKCEYKGDGKCS